MNGLTKDQEGVGMIEIRLITEIEILVAVHWVAVLPSAWDEAKAINTEMASETYQTTTGVMTRIESVVEDHEV